jgi:tetratricopeptide (TPR) repeat protein
MSQKKKLFLSAPYMLNYGAQSIDSADKAIALDATKSYAWSDKARAQFVLDPTSEDAISNAEKAITLDNTNGQAYGTLSELYLNTGNLDKALAAANSHVRIHYDEAHALAVRANIFEELGRIDEAVADRLAMKQKTKLQPEISNEDLKAINKLGWFDEYGSHIDPQLVDGAIVLKVVVEENPTVKRIVFKGN